jgi:hypothetical protein
LHETFVVRSARIVALIFRLTLAALVGKSS